MARIALDADAVICLIPQSEPSTGDAGETSKMFRTIRMDNPSHVLKRMAGKFIISIDGYNDTPMELWEIPDTRAWAHSLATQMPEILYFLSAESAKLLTWCNAVIGKMPNGKTRVEVESSAKFLQYHLNLMSQVMAEVGFTQKEIRLRCDSLTEWLVKGNSILG